MDFKKINELILNNKKEIERLKNSENNADKDRVAYLTDENKKLEEFKVNYQKKAEQLINLESADKKDNKQIEKLRNEMKDDVKKVEKTSQGKLRNVFSALIGQVDKKVHNWWYREGKDKRWESHVAKVNDRYKNVPKYLLRNTGISAGMFLGMGAVVFLFPATSAVLTPIIFGATATFITQTAIKAGVAIYNNTKFGGPLLERTKKLFKGNYQENVQNALYERKASRNIFDRVKEVSYKLVGKKVNTPSESNVEPQEEKTNDKEDKKENNLNLSEEVKNAIEVIKNVNLETATLEELQSIIEWTKDVIKDLPDNYKAEYNKIFARYQMLLDEENKKKNNSNKNGDKAKSNNDRRRKTIKKELSLNELIDSIDVNKMKEIINNNGIEKLNSKEKQQFYTQLLNVLSILRNVSSDDSKLVDVDKENLQKIIDIAKTFKKNEELVKQEITKTKYAMIDKVNVKLYKAEKHGYDENNNYYFSGECVFYVHGKKVGTRYIPLENDDDFHIKSVICREFSGLTSDNINIEREYEQNNNRTR